MLWDKKLSRVRGIRSADFRDLCNFKYCDQYRFYLEQRFQVGKDEAMKAWGRAFQAE